jgi:hypothetical protein
MRNDARPMGEHAGGESPLDSHELPRDTRDSVKHDRQSPIVNPDAERNGTPDDHDRDPTMPTSDSTLNTKI